MKAYLATSMGIGAWIALDDGAPAWEVAASTLSGPIMLPLALAFNLYCLIFER